MTEDQSFNSADEAMDVVRNSERFTVIVNDGDRVNYLGRDEWGRFVINTFIEGIQERRTLPIHEKQLRRLIVANIGEETRVRMTTYDSSPLDNPFENDDEDGDA